MKATKLPSGNYRVRLFLGRDMSGKTIFKSYTASTEKEALRLAYNATKKKPTGKVFSNALRDYIQIKTPVLSPATIRGYHNIQTVLNRDFSKFCNMSVDAIEKKDVQAVINAISMSGKTPKTVKNYNGLISATLKSVDVILGQITLPKGKKEEIVVPTEEEVKNILSEVRGTDLEIPVMLASFAGLRRGEVCGLKWSDIDFKNNIIHVSRDVVMGVDKKWHTKQPKTKASDRYIQFPENHIKRIKEIGELPTMNPKALTNRFARLMNRMGYPYHFHTLRHFCVSYMHSIGIPDSYVMQRCGFENDAILKAIYRHTLSDQEKKFADATNNAFSGFC